MTVRRVFLLLIAPLFLLLAGVNGALLYFWEQAETRRGLQQQAFAAAVTVAAFADGVDDLGAVLADPQRAKTMQATAARIPDLHALYVVRADGLRWIAGAEDAETPRFARPDKAGVLPLSDDGAGRRLATALAPASNGRVVVARIDAASLVARTADLRRLLTALVAGAGVLGFVLAWLVARRIAREVSRAHALVDAPGLEAPAAAAFRIRETRDLAAAVRLMRASVAGRMARGRHELARRDRARGEAEAAAAWRAEARPPILTKAVGIDVAARCLGEAPAGSFHALCVVEDRAALVLGECEGATASEALARALAAQRFCERRLLEGRPEDRLDEAARAFAVRRLAWVDWSADEAPETGILTLLDGEAGEQAAAYDRRAEGLAPDAVIDDLATLLAANGVVAVLRRSQA